MQQQNTQKVEASKVPEYIKKAAKKAAEFNSNLNRERMEERRAYFDLQTHVGRFKFLLNVNSSSLLVLVKSVYNTILTVLSSEGLNSPVTVK